MVTTERRFSGAYRQDGVESGRIKATLVLRLGALALVLSGLAISFTYQQGTLIWAIIAGVFAIVATVAGIFEVVISYRERKERKTKETQDKELQDELTRKRDQLFTIELQPTPNEHLGQYESTNVGVHRINLSLRMALDTQVHFVGIRFEGNGAKPRIMALDDWQWPKGGRPPNVQPPYEIPIQDNTWYWVYTSPHYRLENSRITIGIDFQVEAGFVGSLSVGTTTVDGARRHELPIRVGG